MTVFNKDNPHSTPRKKATREQRIEAVKYIKLQCQQGAVLNETLVRKIWGTGSMVSKLVQYKVLRLNKLEGTHDWITKDAPETVVDKFWKAHGTKPNRPPAPVKYLQYIYPNKDIEPQVTSAPIAEEIKEKFQAKYVPGVNAEGPTVDNGEDLIAKYGGSTNNVPVMPRALFIDNCIQDCIQYKIIEKGAYIDEKLIRAGYL